MNETVEKIIRDYQRQISSLRAENEGLRKRLHHADWREEWTQGLLRQLRRKEHHVA